MVVFNHPKYQSQFVEWSERIEMISDSSKISKAFIGNKRFQLSA